MHNRHTHTNTHLDGHVHVAALEWSTSIFHVDPQGVVGGVVQAEAALFQADHCCVVGGIWNNSNNVNNVNNVAYTSPILINYDRKSLPTPPFFSSKYAVKIEVFECHLLEKS